MRTEFIESETKEDAINLCPWAAVCIKVDGGYICFESVDDAETNQFQI